MDELKKILEIYSRLRELKHNYSLPISECRACTVQRELLDYLEELTKEESEKESFGQSGPTVDEWK